jgi:tetratricopeptide (TPR) repeat protein
MRRWVLVGILVATATWGGWTLIQRHRQAVEHQRETAWLTAYGRAAQMFYGEDYVMAEKTITDILPDAEKSHPNDRRFADLLSMLGTSYRVDHKYDQAEPILKRALQVYERISPHDPVGTERTETNLAEIYLDREDYASAEPYLSDAVSLSEKTPGMPGYERGNALLNLGFIRLMQGRYPEAEQLLNRSVEALAPDSAPWAQRDLANAFYRLGGVYANENRYPEAKQQYLKAMKIQEKLSGPKSREVAHTLRGLADVYQDEGKYAESESFYKQAIHIYEGAVGPEDPDLADALDYLGCLYRDQQQFDIAKARPLLERALAIREKALGVDHPSTANTLSDLSLLEFYEHRYGEAERFAERALPIQEKAYGSESLTVSTTLNRLGLVQRDLKKLAQAESSLKRALTIREKNLPPNHTWISISLDNLASVYLAEGNSARAATLIKRAQAIRSHSSGS